VKLVSITHNIHLIKKLVLPVHTVSKKYLVSERNTWICFVIISINKWFLLKHLSLISYLYVCMFVAALFMSANILNHLVCCTPGSWIAFSLQQLFWCNGFLSCPPISSEFKIQALCLKYIWKSSVLWDIMPCSLFRASWHFEGTHNLQLHSWRTSQTRNQREAHSKQSYMALYPRRYITS
jgi:hypothetical protein